MSEDPRGVMYRDYITPFAGLHYHADRTGFIVWRRGTGHNVELLHIKTYEKGQGHGRALFFVMLDRLKDDPPYHSVYGFTRVSNSEARAFYGALGFQLDEVAGPYADGRAVLFWASYQDLLKKREGRSK